MTAELRQELRDDLRSHLDFHAAVERLWPVLTPEQVLADLYASRDRLASAGGDIDLSGLYRRGLRVDRGGRAAARRAGRAARTIARTAGAPDRARPDSAYAAEVLSILESADRQIAGEDPDELRPTDFVTADVLAARQVPEHLMSVAERAAADRDWRFGHIVVDEAQELSAMDWHVLLRRCPSRSITAVGDLAQRSAPAGAQAWADVLAPHLGSRWTYRTLTVNYRTPSEIMDTGRRRAGRVRAGPAAARVGTGDGREAVAAHRARRRPRRRGACGRRGGAGAAGPRDAGGDRRRSGRPGRLPAQLHTPVSAKGLEFDAVVIVDPERIRAHNPADLYVSMTRATQRLGLLEVAR